MDNPANYRDDPVFEGYVFPEDRDPAEPAEDGPAVGYLVDRDWINDPRHQGNPPQVRTPPIEPPVDPSIIVEGERPQLFKELYLAYCVMFNEYRVRGNNYRRLRQVVGAGDRDAWMRYPYPKKEKANPRDYETEGTWIQESSSNWQTSLNVETSSLFDTVPEKRVRALYGWSREYFDRIGDARFKTRKLLGFNDMNLVVRMSYWEEKSAKHRDLVLKLPSNSLESRTLRDEQRALRKVAGAAHCMQRIDVKELGIMPQKEFPYDKVDPYDTSSEESSGWESPADEAPVPPPTRRERIKTEPEVIEAQKERHWKRFTERINYVNARKEMFKKLKDPHRLRKDLPSPDHDDEWNLWRKDYIFFDFMENGDLEHLLYRLVETETDVPNRVLWSFWLCLIKSCISLEYPPRKFHPRRRERFGDCDGRQVAAGGSSTGKILGDDLFEDIPVPSRRWAGKRFVHFDIDPTNILIGGLDPSTEDGEHSILGDFGTMKKIKPNKANQYYVSKRIVGKYGFYAPEQFGIDWDHFAVRVLSLFIDGLNNGASSIGPYGPQISEQAIAGNYGSWTNIWGIALTMWMVITKLRPPLPPQRSRSTMLDVDEPVHYCPLLLDDPKYNKVDEELRRTIAECMRHAPYTRPTLVDLFEQAKKGASRQFDGETDDFIRRWIQSSYVELFLPFTVLLLYTLGDDEAFEAGPSTNHAAPEAVVSDLEVPNDEVPDAELPDVEMPEVEPLQVDGPGARFWNILARFWQRLSGRSGRRRDAPDGTTNTRNSRSTRLARRIRKLNRRMGRGN
ncbi:hypothetical protein M434DRAFT_32006 [Hypoxylon sp. CO27-5]|nr:hypothetical protein M434DRAFT_32006 [Hypoxylon sp. CO27-5]